MTSLAHDADLIGNNLCRTIHPQSFIAVAFIFSELDRGSFRPPLPVQKFEKKGGLDRVKVAPHSLKLLSFNGVVEPLCII